MLKKLWLDEGGAIISAELVLVMVILVIGMIVGLVALRDAIIVELADMATALGALNMSYTIAGTDLNYTVSGTDGDDDTSTAGSAYIDDVADSNANMPWQGVVLNTDGLAHTTDIAITRDAPYHP